MLGRAVLGRAVLGRAVLGRAVLGRAVLGRAVLGTDVEGCAVVGTLLMAGNDGRHDGSVAPLRHVHTGQDEEFCIDVKGLQRPMKSHVPHEKNPFVVVDATGGADAELTAAPFHLLHDTFKLVPPWISLLDVWGVAVMVLLETANLLEASCVTS